MRTAALQVFDDIISGTATTWYTPAGLNEKLGTDTHAIHACVTQVSGTSPTLTVVYQTSADNQNWWSLPVISGTSVSNEASFAVSKNSIVPVMANVRFAVTLGGTSPVCRLKLYFTGRDNSSRGQM